MGLVPAQQVSYLWHLFFSLLDVQRRINGCGVVSPTSYTRDSAKMIGAWSGLLSECGTRVRVEEGRAASWLCMGLARLAQVVKNLPAMRESRVQSLGWEDPLGKEMATHSSILAWEIPWMEEPGGYSPWGPKEWDMTEQLTLTPVLRRGHVWVITGLRASGSANKGAQESLRSSFPCWQRATALNPDALSQALSPHLLTTCPLSSRHQYQASSE